MYVRNARNNPEPERGRERRANRGSSATSPAFSYYSNRPPETPRVRAVQRVEQSKRGRGRRLPRLSLAGAPFWPLVVVVVVCAAKVLILSTHPKIVVVGKTTVSSSYIHSTDAYTAAAQRALASSLTNHTKLTVDLGGTARTLERQFPELQTVSLGVPLISNRPIVYVQIAQPSIVLQTGGGNYALNASGLALARVQALPNDVPLLSDQSGTTPSPGKQYLPSSTVNFVQTVAYQLKAKHLAVSTFVLPAQSPYELDVRLEGKAYLLRMNLTTDALTQSGAAIATLDQLSADPGSYLDVRVPGRVYYK